MIPFDLELVGGAVKWFANKIKSNYSVKSTHAGFDEDEELFTNFEDVNFDSIYYTGKVTRIENCVAFINDQYSFNLSKVNKDVHVGSVITCVINSGEGINSVEEVSVLDIMVDDDEDEPAPEMSNKNFSVRSAMVSNREGQQFFLSPGALTFNIDEINCIFVPEVGDCVDVNLKVNINKTSGELHEEVISVKYRGFKSCTGKVTWFEEGSGYIDDKITFDRHHCLPDYQPVEGDDVAFTAIRCQRGATRFRTLHVNPIKNEENHLIKPLLYFENIIFLPKHAIRIISEQPTTISAALHNNSTLPYQLTDIKVKEHGLKAIKIIDPPEAYIKLEPKSKIELKINVTGNFVGYSTIKIDFIFDSVVYTGDLLLLTLETSDLSSHDQKKRKTKKVNKPLVVNRNVSSADPGRPFGKVNKFIPVKLGMYPIPDYLLNLYESDESIRKVHVVQYLPCLLDDLSADNYGVYFHSLIYLEELEILKKISCLEMVSAFSVQGDYLCLPADDDSHFSRYVQPGDRAYAIAPWKDDRPHEGIIWHYRSGFMCLKFSSNFHTQYIQGSEYKVSFVIGRSPFRMKHQAVDDSLSYFGTKWLFPLLVNEVFKSPFVVPVTSKADEDNDGIVAVHPYNKMKWNRFGSGYGKNQVMNDLKDSIPTERKKKLEWFNSMVNDEQKGAVIQILAGSSRPLPFIIFGPPGTGKSFTLIESILQIYTNIPESRIVIATQSNSAVDLLALALVASGFVKTSDIARLCGFRYAASGCLPRSLEKVAYLPQTRDAIDGGLFHPKDNYGPDKSDLPEIPQITRNGLSEKRIVLGTLITVGVTRAMGFPRGFFTHFFIDEAAQIVEPDSLVISSLMSKSAVVVFAGDPKQLGPVLLSAVASKCGLKKSFMQRLMSFPPYRKDKSKYPDNFGYNPRYICKLVRSYRALPLLLEIPNQLFYDGELISMVDPETSREAYLYKRIRDIFPRDSSVPMVFYSVKGTELVDAESFSYYNLEEVYQAVSFVVRLYQYGIKPVDIGIITPYFSQGKKITKFMETLKLETPKIGSVEEFQGQERDVIILSTVRSTWDENLEQINNFTDDNDDNNFEEEISKQTDKLSSAIAAMGFVACPQRFNVALTRAKVALIVVGDYHMLCKDRTWRTFLMSCIDNKSFIQ